MKGRTKAIFGLLIVVAGSGVAAVAVRGDDPGTGPATATVARGDIIDKALAVGTIVPEVEVGIKAKVSGVVRRRYADPGDFVQAGSPLLEIKPDPTPLELVEGRREVQLQQIKVDNLTKEAARMRALKDQGLISEQQFDGTVREQAEAALQLQTSRERLALLEQGRIAGTGANAVESVVRSPISGFILEKMVEVGDPVVPLTTYQEGTVLMTMADMKHLLFRGSVDEIDVGRLHEGMAATIKIGALPDATITGIVSRISLKAKKEETATTFPVEITIQSTGNVTLRAGFSANADIIIRKRDQVLTVPERVVYFEENETYVLLPKPDGTSEKRIIKTGLSDAINVEVISGLSENDRILEKPQKEIR
jgi:HlyD family secretion protein